MLVVLEIVLAKALVFLEFSLGNKMNQPIPDDAGGDVQFAGQIMDGHKLHAQYCNTKKVGQRWGQAELI
jgi:hypothetical protein